MKIKSKLTKSQTKSYGWKEYQEEGETYRIRVKVRYDDECGNRHNTFAITADIQHKRGNRFWDQSFGCQHEEVEKHFPELAPFIKWHLFDSTGPMHYVSNTMFHASNKDCWGGSKGKVRGYAHGLRFGNSPITHKIPKSFFDFIKIRHEGTGDFNIVEYAHKDDPKTYGTKYSFAGYGSEWYEGPFGLRSEAEEWQKALKGKVEFVKIPDSWHEGKEREIDSARHCAVWPEATDEELSSPNLKRVLTARLPALIQEFKKDVEALGLVF